MPLDPEHARALVDDGYVILRDAVPRARLGRALKAINHSLGEHGIDKSRIWTLRAQTFCPELVGADAILDLYRGTARPGDAILAHYQLAHGAAANVGPHVRYAVFFRLAHCDHDPASTAT